MAPAFVRSARSVCRSSGPAPACKAAFGGCRVSRHVPCSLHGHVQPHMQCMGPHGPHGIHGEDACSSMGRPALPVATTKVTGPVTGAATAAAAAARAPAAVAAGAAGAAAARVACGGGVEVEGGVVVGASRRWFLAAAAAVATVVLTPVGPGMAEGGASQTPFTNSKQGYVVEVPAGWEKIDKAGADVLFEDPNRRSTSLGVTVNPVRVTDISGFGTLEAVGEKLLEAERKKESTLGATMVAQSSRRVAGNALLYDYEYDLDSTRGHKRILNTVTIYKSKLYILNAQYKCEKSDEGCSSSDATQTVGLLRSLAATFNIL